MVLTLDHPQIKQLRPYQEEFVDGIRDKIRGGAKAILNVAGTGAGKTVCFCWIAIEATKRSRQSLITVHRDTLIENTVSTLRDDFGYGCGVLAPGYRTDWSKDIIVASIDSLRNRKTEFTREGWFPSLVIIDEAHRSVAKTWETTIDYFKGIGSIILGFTATPKRLDGKGFESLYDEMVLAPSTKWLIENRFLCPYRVFSIPLGNFDNITSVAGDFNQAELSDAIDRPDLVGDVVESWLKYAKGKRTITFGVNIQHCQNMVEAYNQAGLVYFNREIADYVSYEKSKKQNREILQRFRDGDLLVVANVNLFTEGVNVPDAEVYQGVKPTQSLIGHLQGIGRVLRYKPGKVARILDHAGNIIRHGHPDDDFGWKLEGNEEVRLCPNCGVPVPTVIAPNSVCSCGYAFNLAPSAEPGLLGVKADSGGNQGELLIGEGELIEYGNRDILAELAARLSMKGIKKQDAMEDFLRLCPSKKQLQAAAKIAGYKPGWAHYNSR